MNHKHVLACVVLFASQWMFAQNSIDQALNSIAENNKTLLAAKQYVAAKSLTLRTGITPENPFVTADYMIGRPVSGGNQLDFLAVQAFDFPSAYSKKSNLADENEALLTIQLKALTQDILLEAKSTLLELIYLNKQAIVLQGRAEESAKILANYQLKFDAEAISALELNKAKIQLLNFQSELRKIENDVLLKTEHLTELNGGKELKVSATEYPIQASVPAFETLEDSIEVNDPTLKQLNQQVEVYEATLLLNKAMALPKLEIGYHYQSVLGQTFNGAHVGVSIPLWENKNKVKAANANIQLGSLEVEEHKVKHYYEIKEWYQHYENLKQTVAEYKSALDELNSEKILLQSLELGEINFITYATEIQYYYTAKDTLSALEKECQLVLAQLFKYQL